MLFCLRSLLFISSLLALALSKAPNPIAGAAAVTGRDPTVIYREDTQTYYMFGTGKGMRIFKAPALDGPWKQAGYVMPNNCSKIEMDGHCDLWAGDIHRLGNQLSENASGPGGSLRAGTCTQTTSGTATGSNPAPALLDARLADFVPQTDTLFAHTAETRLASLCR
ncbi:hypothetical protein AURDEDRAFT_161736 [Auricularia subglabra TFB-10046 SS5]|nr:hypothetical protein AURDEDRAFT_161736 [Auricularia subglabra TFB-10046 SS5]